ncbi:hypothetical protein ACFOSD_02125 [Salinispirillum marinum]|uniref:DUF3575 domain-containing protein n=2 Tax=Saccharospirillaceae TaxID=255527 RepID=A0ABV8BBH0_9GAMM
MKQRLSFSAVLMLVGLLTSPLSLAAESSWFWHYTPASLRATQAISFAKIPSAEQGRWQARLHLGYELESYGLGVLWQHPMLEAHPNWGLDTGITVLWDTRDDLTLDSVTTHTRWRWLKTWGDFRVDAGYGVQGQWVNEAVNAWRLRPSFDATLGWRL